MNQLLFRIGLSFLCCGLLGCSVLRDSADCSTEDALFEDSFDDNENRCQWQLVENGSETAMIEDELLRMTVEQEGILAWSVAEPLLEDVEISAQIRQRSGSDNNAYGLICRYQDEENFYLFLISGDGYYAIAKYEDGNEIDYLTGEKPDYYVESEIISQGNTTNQMRIRCEDDELTLFVNGTELVTVTDSAFADGQLGVAVTTYVEDPLTIDFDKILVVAP